LVFLVCGKPANFSLPTEIFENCPQGGMFSEY